MKNPPARKTPKKLSAKEVDEQLCAIKRGVVDLVAEAELRQKIERNRKPLRVKLGVDPSTPDLHLGHVIPLFKLKDFQELGHQAVLIIGDGTARIGDPTGQNKARPSLSKEEVEKNAKTYIDQAKKVLYFEDVPAKDNPTHKDKYDIPKAEVVHNGECFEKMDFFATVKLASRFTVARMLERDYFAKRWKAGTEIRIHELLYPLMQGWDSVMVHSDVELGGTDQLFNLLVGRELQGQEGQEPQVCLTMPLLPGTDGRKMSKSYANAIEIQSPANEMFGKLMSIPDDLMKLYFECLTRFSKEEISDLLSKHPREAKARLAREIVGCYCGKEEAEKASREFDRVFKERKKPTEIPEFQSSSPAKPVDLILLCKFTSSKSEARRLITQGGVRIEDERVQDIEKVVTIPKGGMILQVGKRRFARVRPSS